MNRALCCTTLILGTFLPFCATATPPTAEEAEAFVASAEEKLLAAWKRADRAEWIQENFITADTDALAAEARGAATQLEVELAKAAARFDGLELPADVERKLALMKRVLNLPTPADEKLAQKLSELDTGLSSAYGSGKACDASGHCRDLTELSQVMAKSRDAQELLEAWSGWHTVSRPMRGDFEQLVAISNQGSRELGYSDVGALWRSKYDMDPGAFAAEVDRLWGQVRPLYEALHCHVRAKLGETYGKEVVDPKGPIPAHLLGNMWAQEWANVYELVAPAKVEAGYDLDQLLAEHKVDELEMVRIAERFFTSLGFAPLPETFWERSLFIKPQDREVVCHASAWNVDWEEDLRIKMCIEKNAEDFRTIHHELGHNFYQRAYRHQPPLYRESANDGFHEAVGDAVALSVTPRYLVDLGWLKEEPGTSADVGLLLRQALDKVAFLPFGLLVDQWRWKVFSGEVSPATYNQAWWQLREKYQGVKAPVVRSETDFDPGAKYHVAASVSYTRYFLAHILQFQFHRELCKAAGYEGPLHRCSIYGNQAAGKRLKEMLEMGLSRPWPEALEAIAGSREMDATAIIDYFAPLKTWLDEQNQGRVCGW